ncbi:MAG: hypothetical protein ACQEVA_22940 [Myxococcota bacterium]
MKNLLPITVIALLSVVALACTPDEPDGQPSDAGTDAVSAPTCAASDELLYYFDEERRLRGIGDITGNGVGEFARLQQDEDGFVLSLGPEAGVVMGSDGYLLNVMAEDVNADGQLDLILAQPWKSVVAIFFGPVRNTVSWEAADLVFSAPTNGGLENLFGASVVVGKFDEDSIVDLLIAAPAEGEEACAGQEPPRVYLGPLEPGRYDRGDADFELDAPESSCIGLSAKCFEGAMELVGQREEDCARYEFPIAESAATSDQCQQP